MCISIFILYKTAQSSEISRLHLWQARTPRYPDVSRRPSTPKATRATVVQGLTGDTGLPRFTGSQNPGPPGTKDSQVSQHKKRHLGPQRVPGHQAHPGVPGLTEDPGLSSPPGLKGLPRRPACGGCGVSHSYRGKRKICQLK